MTNNQFIGAWMPEEEAELRSLYPQADVPVSTIARKLGRSVSAIHNRAFLLGLKKPPKLAPLTERVCIHCGSTFMPTRHQFKKGQGWSCSISCGFRAHAPERSFSFSVIEELSIPEPNSGCWLWTAGSGDGYGGVLVEGEQWAAHRLSYATYHNIRAIPKGLVVRHRCDNKPCVNPEHLEIGTLADNSRDAVLRDKVAHGSRQGGAKLSERDIPIVREMARNGISQTAIGRAFNVSTSLINQLLSGKIWRRA